jgi:hypothetical protein
MTIFPSNPTTPPPFECTELELEALLRAEATETESLSARITAFDSFFHHFIIIFFYGGREEEELPLGLDRSGFHCETFIALDIDIAYPQDRKVVSKLIGGIFLVGMREASV